MRTSIILFLNKVDIFKAKLPRSPLGNYFPDYSGGNDVNKAAKYLLWRFNQVNRAHLNLYPQYVTSPTQSVRELTCRPAALLKRRTHPIFDWCLRRLRKRFSTMHLRIPAFCEGDSLHQLRSSGSRLFLLSIFWTQDVKSIGLEFTGNIGASFLARRLGHGEIL